MKFAALLIVTSFIALRSASAASGIATLDCTVANRYGQSVISYDPASGDVRFVTNRVKRVAMKIFFVQDLADSVLRIRLSVPKVAIQYDLDVQMADTAKTPAGSPARLSLASNPPPPTNPAPMPPFPGSSNGMGSGQSGGQLSPAIVSATVPMFAEGFCNITLR